MEGFFKGYDIRLSDLKDVKQQTGKHVDRKVDS